MRMLLKSVDIFPIMPKIIMTKNLKIFPNVKYKESAKILQFLLRISLKHKYTEKNSENGKIAK